MDEALVVEDDSDPIELPGVEVGVPDHQATHGLVREFEILATENVLNNVNYIICSDMLFEIKAIV